MPELAVKSISIHRLSAFHPPSLTIAWLFSDDSRVHNKRASYMFTKPLLWLFSLEKNLSTSNRKPPTQSLTPNQAKNIHSFSFCFSPTNRRYSLSSRSQKSTPLRLMKSARPSKRSPDSLTKQALTRPSAHFGCFVTFYPPINMGHHHKIYLTNDWRCEARIIFYCWFYLYFSKSVSKTLAILILKNQVHLLVKSQFSDIY